MRTAYELSDWQGYMTHEEIDAMKSLANILPPYAVIVKIGAGAGTDTLAILEERKNVVIFSIDIAAGEQPHLTNEHLRLKECGYDETGQVIRIWGDSKLVSKKWPMKINWLHIDGDHSEEGIKGDLLSWFRYVIEDGFISFHDYDDPVWPAVKLIVDKYMSEQEYLPDCSAGKFKAFRKLY